MSAPRLPASLIVLERGWLSANNIIGLDGEAATMIDSGYVTHAAQTVELVRHAVDGRRLARLVNTHGHSDHIGCNAAVQTEFGCRITVPAGIAPIIEAWDETALLLRPADQQCDRFRHDDTVDAGDRLAFGGCEWSALAAPGHDMHALMFHSDQHRLLISGDALWRDGFGVQFPELLGTDPGLAATRATLETIARLSLDGVLPGHGAPFTEVDDALARAFARLDAFEDDAERMARNAIRALLSFSLMECRSIALDALPAYLDEVSMYRDINRRYLRLEPGRLAERIAQELVRAGVARIDHGMLHAN
ncbi:MAG: MBL fold metallo-hydrolase [Zoogloeaceae bacterium]|nr:MBL fold metallo-hydrolase [Rhodocyclaceae bacterium]MCP5236852.1 MBL fold metallo-hydrolase [Zoogloeaceae bacterium]